VPAAEDPTTAAVATEVERAALITRGAPPGSTDNTANCGVVDGAVVEVVVADVGAAVLTLGTTVGLAAPRLNRRPADTAPCDDDGRPAAADSAIRVRVGGWLDGGPIVTLADPLDSDERVAACWLDCGLSTSCTAIGTLSAWEYGGPECPLEGRRRPNDDRDSSLVLLLLVLLT
jgi:hypothetical protein